MSDFRRQEKLNRKNPKMEKPVFPQQITEAAKRYEANQRGGSQTFAPPEIRSGEWVDELRGIVASGMSRGGRTRSLHSSDPAVSIIQELFLTKPEYDRLRHLVSSSTEKLRDR